MLINYIISAIILGIIVAIPPGSVTIIACQRALQFGFRNSIFFTLGSSVSDIFYLLLVNLGITHFFSANLYMKIVLWIICGIILIILGVTSIVSIHKNYNNEKMTAALNTNPFTTFISGILVTLSNPVTIVGWIAVAGNFFLIWNERYPVSKNYSIISIGLIITGVLLWFIPLTFIISKLRHRMNTKLKNWLIIISNICLLIFGIMAFYYAITTIFTVL